MQRLADHRETSRDGDGLEYGPFDDLEGRELAWLVILRLEAETTRFAVNVADLGTTDPTRFASLFDGHLALDDGAREGAFTLDMSTLDAHRALSERLAPASSHAGTVAATFERHDDDARIVELAFTGFRVDAWSSDETWSLRRDADGWSTIDLALLGDLAGRSSVRVEIDARWHDDRGGRVRARVLDADDTGDLVVDECFDAAGMLSHRAVSPADAVLPGYAFGDERTCVVSADELSRRRARSAAQRLRE